DVEDAHHQGPAGREQAGEPLGHHSGLAVLRGTWVADRGHALALRAKRGRCQVVSRRERRAADRAQYEILSCSFLACSIQRHTAFSDGSRSTRLRLVFASAIALARLHGLRYLSSLTVSTPAASSSSA